MKTGILFDLDGTLLDTLDDLTDAVNYAMAQYGCPARSREDVCAFTGNGAEYLIRMCLPGKDNDPPLAQVVETYRKHYAANSRTKTGPYPGIMEALAELGKKYPIAIVSNKPDVAVKPLCRDCFGDIYALGETADCPRKPAPDMVFRGMQAIGVENCIYVGDSEVDVVTAKNAGVKCLSVLWGFRDEECLRQAGGAYFCSDPAQLPAMLESMM